jgi:hypothetical protein
MSQISPPIRILLVCAVALLAAWMLVLKPGPATVEATAAPAAVAATTAPANATAATTEAAAPAAEPAADLDAARKAGMPERLVSALADHKILAVLFWNPKAADDRAVRAQLRSVATGKDVVVHVAPVTDVARYQAIAGGVDVQQSPTLVVVDRNLQAEALVGYSHASAIAQAIDDARRAGRK